ncbi:MAG TPA: AmmeMemoRadiSam system protein B [Patescibacteria group bacterium]|nr:AmmeMemoRadiSam system protein B [Patescibacteria group bacterium]
MGKRNWQCLLVALAITLLAWMVFDVAGQVRINSVPIVLLPHFDGAKPKRTALLQKLDKQIEPKSIIILSVNHYQAGLGNIIATAKDWRLSEGIARGDGAAIEGLGGAVSVDADGNSFLNEHGINNLLPELYRFFPGAKYSALMIHEGTKQAVIDKLYDGLKSQCVECLVVASVDFSHYVSSEVAQEQDKAALRALSERDASIAWQVKADSPQIVYLITRWAAEKNWRFQLVERNDASAEFHTPPAENVSYILGYFVE